MLIKPAAANSPVTTACTNCGAEEPLLLQNVHHQGTFRRLCTTYVLRLHPHSFCPTCFEVYPPPPPNGAVLTCFKCRSSTHSNCAATGPTPPPSPYICPLCISPNTPIFRLKTAKEANLENAESLCVECRVMDRDAARKLLAAAKIVCASMNRASAMSRADAERRTKEAAFSRKRAKEALEHVACLVVKEKLRKKEAASQALVNLTGPEGNPVIKEEKTNALM